MGTRADFYVGRGKTAEWIGSIAFDGYPEGIVCKAGKRPGPYDSAPDGKWPEGKHLFDAKTEEEFRERVARYFLYRDDVTLPEQGWPWPWDDSNTTDYAYAFDVGKVWQTCFGEGWFLANEEESEVAPKIADFPDMSSRKRVALGNRSGMIILTAPGAK